VHFVVLQITDLPVVLASMGQRNGAAFPLVQGRGDEARHRTPLRDASETTPAGPRARNPYIRDLHLDAIKVKGSSGKIEPAGSGQFSPE
jgi:error-prone DNA polymerase